MDPHARAPPGPQVPPHNFENYGPYPYPHWSEENYSYGPDYQEYKKDFGKKKYILSRGDTIRVNDGRGYHNWEGTVVSVYGNEFKQSAGGRSAFRFESGGKAVLVRFKGSPNLYRFNLRQIIVVGHEDDEVTLRGSDMISCSIQNPLNPYLITINAKDQPLTWMKNLRHDPLGDYDHAQSPIY